MTLFGVKLTPWRVAAAALLAVASAGTTVVSAQDYCPPGDGTNSYSAWNAHVAYLRARRVTGFARVTNHARYATPVDPFYRDPRDGWVYSAPGYGTPMSVPLAPVVRAQYNYSWGVPSSRLSPVGARYTNFHPGHWTTQSGNMEANGHVHPPMIYTPTDTTHLGYYHSYAPRWIPAPRNNWSNTHVFHPGRMADPYAGAVMVGAPATNVAPASSGVRVPPPAPNP